MRYLRAILVLHVLACLGFGCLPAGAATEDGGLKVQDEFPDPVVALISAVELENSAAAKRLLGLGAKVNYPGKHGITPLIWVMHGGDRNAVERLLRLGADPNQKAQGNSATWIAAGHHDPQMLELILRYRGDPNTVGDDGSSALEIAVKEHFDMNVDVLARHGANLNYVDNHRETAATWAAITGAMDLVAHLLDLGYSYDLQSLARTVDGLQVDAEEQPWKIRIARKLQDRGVQYPLKHAVPDGNRGGHGE